MTNQQAIAIIQNRIGEMVKTEAIQTEMVKMNRQGKSNDEIQAWLTMAAIATLCG